MKLSSNHAIDPYPVEYFFPAPYTKNARALLSVFCLLSPDITHDSFYPKNQSVLGTFLDFCRQDVRKIATLSPALQAAIKELVDANWIRRETRILSVRRVVQEAFFHVFTEERQKAFDAGVRISLKHLRNR